MADDDQALRAKLAALEAEVKADAAAARARRDLALATAKARPAPVEVEPTPRRSALVTRSRRSGQDDAADGLGGALELAGRANRVKQELAKKPGKGEKSWIKSGVASMALGPLGWLYAGSLREAIPASAVWLTLALTLGKILPTFLLLPVLMVALPLSGIAGVMYALQYNRHGERQRLFDRDDKAPKQLDGG